MPGAGSLLPGKQGSADTGGEQVGVRGFRVDDLVDPPHLVVDGERFSDPDFEEPSPLCWAAEFGYGSSLVVNPERASPTGPPAKRSLRP